MKGSKRRFSLRAKCLRRSESGGVEEEGERKIGGAYSKNRFDGKMTVLCDYLYSILVQYGNLALERKEGRTGYEYLFVRY